MIRFLGIAATAMAMISVEPVSAQTFSTTGGVYTFSGSGVAIRKGLGSPLNCFMSVDITNDGMGTLPRTISYSPVLSDSVMLDSWLRMCRGQSPCPDRP